MSDQTATMQPARDRHAGPWLVAVLLALACCDFYVRGVRVFEMVAFAMMLLLVVHQLWRPVPRSRWRTAGGVMLFAVVYFLLGVFGGGHLKTAVGLLVGCALFSVVRGLGLKISTDGVRLIVGIHLCFFFLQFATFHLTGEVLNFHQFTDIEPRLVSSVVRPAGLFYEPAKYCLILYMLLRLLHAQRIDAPWLEYSTALSMVLSASIWGAVAALFLMGRRLRSGSFGAWVVIGLVFALGVYLADRQNELYLHAVQRLQDIGEDGSFISRFVGSGLSLETIDSLWFFFGSGFGAEFESLGSNAVYYLVSTIGLVGLLLGLFVFPTPGESKGRSLLMLLPIAVAAPIFAYGLFAFWLAQLFVTQDLLQHRQIEGRTDA